MGQTKQQDRSAFRHRTAWATTAVTLDGVSMHIQGEFSWSPTDGLIGRLSLEEQHAHVRQAAELAVVQHIRWVDLAALLLVVGREERHPDENAGIGRSGPSPLKILSVGIPAERGGMDEARALFALQDALFRFRFRMRRRRTPWTCVPLVAKPPIALGDVPRQASVPRSSGSHA